MKPTLVLAAGRVDLVRGVVHRDGEPAVQLTTKEREVLGYLAARPGEVVSRETLLVDVWGHARAGVTRAVDHTIRRLRGKIERDPSDPAHVLTVHGAGYRFVGAPSPPPGREPPHSHPTFIGRRAELHALTEASRAARLVTVLGPGGAGKTRLVRQFLGDRGAFVDLTEARSAGDLDDEVAATLGVPVADLVEALASGPRLLVLDNLEQVVDLAAERVETWLAAAPELRVIGTSRARLRVPGERILELQGLDQDDAVDLFVARARAVGSGPLDAPEIRVSIARLVARLDHLPLAIELAAARSRVLGPEDLLERLDARFRTLATNPAAHPRHQALGAAISWSWDLLDPSERAALARLTAFRGGFDLRAAEPVIGADALDRVQTLRDRSLLVQVPGAAGRVRLGMLESIRAFVSERDPDQVALGREAHARHFASIASDLRRAAGAGRAGRLRLVRERDNLTVAHETARQAGDVEGVLDLAEALEVVLAARGQVATWEALVASTRSSAPGPRAEALALRLLLARGRADEAAEHAQVHVEREPDNPTLLALLGRARRGQQRYDEAAELLQLARTRTTDPVDRAHIDHQLGLVAYDQEHWRASRDAFERASEALTAAGHTQAIGRIRLHLGHVAIELGDLAEAQLLYAEAATAFVEDGDRRGEAIAIVHQALAAQELGDVEAAQAGCAEGLAVHIELGNRRFVAFTHLLQSSLALGAGDGARALSEATAARRILRGVGDERFEAVAAARQAAAHALGARVEAAEHALAEARALADGQDAIVAGVEVLAGFVDLARGDVEGARERIAASSSARGNFARVARRQLARRIGDQAQRTS